MGNALVATRLSHDTDGSTSVERQTEQGTLTARVRGDKLIEVTEDVDVSGSISPFERDDLGPWLTDPEKRAQWDTIIVAKLDRLTRSLKHFNDFREWCDANGKTIVSVAESLDLGTATGRMFANLLAMFAEFERERISERRQEAGQKLRTAGYCDGGYDAPLGLAVEKIGDRNVYVVDDADAARVRQMAVKVMAGESAESTGRSAGMGKGCSGTVIKILRNPALAGIVTYHGDIVRDSDGMPVMRAARVFTDGEWAELQDALTKNSTRGAGHTKNDDVALLLGVLHCGRCGEKLFISRRPAGPVYRHGPRSGCTGTISALQAEKALTERLLALVGDTEQVELLTVRGENHDDEIKRVEKSLNDIDAAVESGDMTPVSAGRLLGRLESKLEHLRNLPRTPDTIREVPTGTTYRAAWDAMDDAQRASWLRDSGIRMIVGGDAEVIADPRMFPVGAFTIGRADKQKTVVIRWGALSDLGNRAQAA